MGGKEWLLLLCVFVVFPSRASISVEDLNPTQPCGENCVDTATHRDEFKRQPQTGIKGVQEQLERDLMAKEIHSYLDLLEFERCRLPVVTMQDSLHRFRYVLAMFDEVSNETLPIYRSDMYTELFERPGPKLVHLLKVIRQISTKQNQSESLIACYFHAQSYSTNITSSACYLTQKFHQRTFEFLYDILATLELLGPLEAKNELAKDHLRSLLRDQSRYVLDLCASRPTFVIPAWTNNQTCAVRISKSNFTEKLTVGRRLSAITGLPIRLWETPDGLAIVSDMSSLHSTKQTQSCTPIAQRRHKKHFFYISTQSLSVASFQDEWICAASLVKQRIPLKRKPNQHKSLILLKVEICKGRRLRVVRTLKSRPDSKYVEKVDFPIRYNSGIVGSAHQTPFFITSMSLYLDELQRIAVKITSSVNINNRTCSAKFSRLGVCSSQKGVV